MGLFLKIEENDKKCADIRTRIRDLNQRRLNKVGSAPYSTCYINHT